MNTVTLDTHQAVKDITDAGFNDRQAEAIVSTIFNAMNANLATKMDIAELRVDMEAIKTELKAEILILKWMVGLVVAVEVLPFLKHLFG